MPNNHEPEVLQNFFPEVWAKDSPLGLVIKHAPMMIEFYPSAAPIIKQYPMSRGAQLGNLPCISHLQLFGILGDCHSPWSTSLLPVKKPNGDYQPAQDLYGSNAVPTTSHLMVTTLYTFLGLLLHSVAWFTFLDLKVAFFVELHPPASPSLPLNGKAQRWDRKNQLT